MRFGKIENGVLVEIVLEEKEGYVAVPDDAVCGQILQADGSFVNPPPSLDTIKARYEIAVQNFINAAAVSAGYDSIASAVTYADEPAVPKFQAEGQALRAWRSLCWAYCYQALDDVQSGERPQPTVEELIDELPALALPA